MTETIHDIYHLPTRGRPRKDCEYTQLVITTLEELGDFFRPLVAQANAYDSRSSLSGWNSQLVNRVRKHNITRVSDIEDILSESLADCTDALINNYSSLNIGIINRIIFCRCMDFISPSRNNSRNEVCLDLSILENVDEKAFTNNDPSETVAFWQAFAVLNDQDKSILLLRYFFNLGVNEIVDQINDLEVAEVSSFAHALIAPIKSTLRAIARKPKKDSVLEFDPDKVVSYPSVESRLSRARANFWEILIFYGLVNGETAQPEADEQVLQELVTHEALQFSAEEDKPTKNSRKSKAQKKKKSPIEVIFEPDTVGLRQYELA